MHKLFWAIVIIMAQELNKIIQKLFIGTLKLQTKEMKMQ